MSTAQSGNAFSPFHRFPVIIGNIRIPLFFKFAQNPNNLKFKMEKEYNTAKTIGGYVFEHWGKKPMTLSGSVRIKKDANLGNLIGLNTDTTDLGIEDAVYSPELTTLMTLFNIDQRKLYEFENSTANKVQTIASNGATYAVAGLAALSNPITTVTAGLSLAQSGYDYFTGSKNKFKFREPEPSSIEGYMSTLTDTIILYKGVIYSGFFTEMDYEEDGERPFFNKVDFKFLVTNTTTDWLDTSLTQTASGRTLASLWGAATTATTLGSMLEDLLKDTGSNTNGHV